MAQTTVQLKVNITGIPTEYASIIPPELDITKMLHLMDYIGMTNCTHKNLDGTLFKSTKKYTSYKFLQCKPYSECKEEYTPIELEKQNNNPVDGSQHTFDAIDCRCPMDQKMKCVYVCGITQNYDYFDGIIPCHILESWTTVN